MLLYSGVTIKGHYLWRILTVHITLHNNIIGNYKDNNNEQKKVKCWLKKGESYSPK